MKLFLSKYLTVVPPLMVGLSYAFTHLITMDAYWYYLLSNLIGFSIITNIVFVWVYFYSNKNYCWFTKLSVIAMIILNIGNIIAVLFGFEEFYNTYCFLFETFITSMVVFLSIILALKKL